MTTVAVPVAVDKQPAPWTLVVRAACALAAAMGVGRFVYTPIMPLMQDQAGLAAQPGAHLATANYLGYLIGAVAGIIAPSLLRSPRTLHLSLIVLIATLALMPATHDDAIWIGLRLIAGVVSAVIFMVAVSALHAGLRGHAHHLTGWAFGGVGAGIAASGVVVLVVRDIGDWRLAWWASALLAVVFAAAGWTLHGGSSTETAVEQRVSRTQRQRFGILGASYTLEGVGYIIAGTFLVAAIEHSGPAWIGSGAWIVVGLAALPSAALWARLAHRWSRSRLLFLALLIQSAGIAVAGCVDGVVAAVISAVLFGATFMGISTLALSMGAELRFPRAVAVLTTGYSLGQVVGPLVAAPALRHGYHPALLLGAAVVSAAAVAASLLQLGYGTDSSARISL